MKNLSKAGAALLVAAVFVFASCETGAEIGVITIGGLSVDTASHHGSAAAFRVRNDTNLLLVAFRNSVHPNNLLGGIPENAQNHGIRDDRALLIPNADAFPVILITREQLEAHSGNWSHLNQNPFSRIFVFYNRNAEPGFPAEVYTISGHLGGNYRLTIMNPTNHNWEIRLGGQRGLTLGYVTSGMQEVTLLMGGGQHLFFPVIRSFNPVLGRLNTIYPRGSDGQPWFTGQLINNPAGHTFNLNLAMGQVNTNGLTLGVAWLVVHNGHAHSAVQMRRGGQFFQNQIGHSFINAGDIREFHIEMPAASGNAFGEYIYNVSSTKRETPTC